MEIRKKRNRWGDYYLVTTTLRVNGKAFRVSQTRADPNKPVHSWRVNRAQMRKILEITMIDGTEYGDRIFRPANAGTIAWIRRFCLDSEGDRIEYITGDQDQYGNKLEKGVFELWNVATHHYQLKPARDDLVRIDEDGKNEIPDVIDLSELEPTQN
ncbi:MAG: hypothetical protein JRD89_09355 [Deltaproteobacteria bacterium]|nr:hypothetical protein [Deltaproteobacteria bacterium]